MSNGRGLSISLILFLAALAAASPAQALIHYVDSSRPNDSGDGLSWATAKKTIQGAINATTAAHQVWVKKGTYAEALTFSSGAAVYGGFAGNETQLSQRAGKPQETILDGRPVSAKHVVSLRFVTSAVLDGFTITGGDDSGSDYYLVANGGGGLLIVNSDATILIENCVIHDNTGSCGGGVSIYDASPVFRRCLIYGNRAGGGGGVYCSTLYLKNPDYTPDMSTTKPEFTSCTFANNLAHSGSGGAMAAWQTNVIMKGCTLSGNVAASDGGAIATGYAASKYINCVFSANVARGWGGALNLFEEDRSEIVNCVIDGNAAAQGGAVGNTFRSDTIVSNSILARNANVALHPYGEGSRLTPRHCLFYANAEGDHRNSAGATVSGANAINLGVAGAFGNVTGDPLFAAGLSGVWSGAPQYEAATTSTLLTVKNGGLTPGALQGRLIRIDSAQPTQTLVLDNTATTVRVVGNASAWAPAGGAWQVVDYHLRDGSAALDRGEPCGLAPDDFEGDARPGADGLYDIGADEAPAAFLPPSEGAAPISFVSALPANVTSVTLPLQIIASDDASGVASVHVYYRRNGGSWTQYPDAATSVSASTAWKVAFNSAQTGGDGTYEFHSVACDRAGNVEPAPATADASTTINTAFNSAVVYVDGAATGKNTGESWQDACRTIAKGLEYAVRFNIREVWVARGRYSEALALPGNVSLIGGLTPGATDLSQRDTKPFVTVIDASKANGGQPALHAIKMNSIANTSVDGFTITGGVANYSRLDGYDPGDKSGGGVFCARTTACAIVNCTITGNSAEEHGGGISTYYGDVDIRKCLIFENDGFYGGGVSFEEGVSRLRESRVCANTSKYVAGIYVGVYYDTSSLMIEDNVISANSVYATSAETMATGGMMIYSSAAPIRVRNCIISGNYSTSGVGGIQMYRAGAWIVNCTIVDNSSKSGLSGAVHVIDALNNPLLQNLILAGNSMNAPTIGTRTAPLTDCLQSADSRTSYSLAGSPRFLMGPGGTLTSNASVAYGAIRATLTDAKARWTPGALIGQVVIPDLSRRYQALVIDNTTTTLLVSGLYSSWQAPAGRKYQFIDYHLACGSPALDVGNMNYAAAQDMEGNPREMNVPGVGREASSNVVDLGAYEMWPNTPPRLRVASGLDPIDFGSIDIIDGPTPPRNVTLYNLGYTTLNFPNPGIRLAGPDAADFTTATVGALASLDPGTSRTVALAFDPTTTGTKTAALLITSDDPAAPLTTVSLSGQGIIPQPKVTKAPKTQTVDPYTKVIFSVAATGRSPLSYQWYCGATALVDGLRISGSQTTTLTLTRVTQANEGAYSCKVTSPVGSVASSSGWLYVNPTINLISADGELTPAPGLYTIRRGSTFTVTLTSTTLYAGPKTRFVCTGWTAPNLNPSSGAPTARLSFYSVAKDSTVTLHWKTQHALQAAVDPTGYGTVAPGAGWYDAGPLSLEARPSSIASLFTGWSGALSGEMTSASLNLTAPASVTAHFAMRPGATGIVSINVRPPTVGWTLKDSLNRVMEGAGPARTTVASGPLSLTWKTPLNYNAPAVNPVLRDLSSGGEISILELFDPTSDAKRRQGNAIVRYLLGLTSNPAGLDLNGDGKVNIADLSRTF